MEQKLQKNCEVKSSSSKRTVKKFTAIGYKQIPINKGRNTEITYVKHTPKTRDPGIAC